MATTGNQIFEYAMSLIDERLDTGLVDATSTAIFKKNTPYILTMLQDELIESSNYTKTETITITSAVDTAGHYIAHTMPSDFYNESQLISIETEGNYEKLTDYKWEGNNILLIPDKFVGTIKVVYKPIPAPITALTDELILDDITCRTILTNGLASRLLTNENKVLAGYFNQIYNELKNRPKMRKLANAETIKDHYDSSLTY